VVIAIIAVLAGLLVPSLRQARDAAIRENCAVQMKQVTLASTIYSMIADWTVWAADMQNDIDNL
jgi:type II secretory pathway pseudopilin PulG